LNTAYTCQIDFDISFGEKAVWAREAAQNMQKSSDKVEVIFDARGGHLNTACSCQIDFDISFGEKAVWAGEAAQNMQKSSDKIEVILTREGAI
jgi:hypothetical protein